MAELSRTHDKLGMFYFTVQLISMYLPIISLEVSQKEANNHFHFFLNAKLAPNQLN